jgi:hypothetical protein
MNGGNPNNIDGMFGAHVNHPKKNDRKLNFGNVMLSWEAYDFDLKPKSFRWFLLAALFILIGLGYLIWERDWFTLVIFIIIIAVGFWYIQTAKPKLVTYGITPLGITVDGRLHPFSEIHSFWIVYNEKVQRLYVGFTKKYLPPLNIDLKEVDPVLLKSILLTKIPEQEKRGESITDKIIRIIGL